MIEVTTSLHLRDVVDGYEQMGRRARDLAEVFRRLLPTLRKDVAENIRQRHSADGGRWPGPASSTMSKRLSKANTKAKTYGGRRRKRTSNRPLGKLATANKLQYGRDFIRIVSTVPWSGAHVAGDTVGRGVKLPERPYMFGSEAFLRLAEQKIVEHVRAAF